MFKICVVLSALWFAVMWWQYTRYTQYIPTECKILRVEYYNRKYAYLVNYTDPVTNTCCKQHYIDTTDDYLRYINKTVECYYTENNHVLTFDRPVYVPYVVILVIYITYTITIGMWRWCRKCYNTCDRNEYRDRLNAKRYCNEESEECVVCYERPKSTRLGCGHVVTCYKCARECKQRNVGCPVCRIPITSMQIGVYIDGDYTDTSDAVDEV